MASSSNISIQKKSFKYDVFISFRGEDTRNTFVGHLYEALKQKGIYTYKDDDKIQKGERINEDLINAIEDSRFHIIVFSKSYAYSSWCLEELVKIMDCHKMTQHTAWPVFYDVEPTEVRKQSGAVGEAFAKHEKAVRNQSGEVRIAFFMNKKKAILKKWKGTLNEAAGLAGWELKNTLDGREAKFINKIVEEISLKLRSINSGFDEKLVDMDTQVKDVVPSVEVGFDGKLVGMETRVMDVISSLEVGIDEVRMIGIKGIGGGGKTTAARAVFDYLSNSNDFEAVSFVENVSEASKCVFGLEKLQEQVLSNVLNEQVSVNGVFYGIQMMTKEMCCKKGLLVLDDVDHIDQLKALAGERKWFKPGSRILITTRDEQVLVSHRAVFDHVSADFEAKSFAENVQEVSTDNPVASSSNISVQKRLHLSDPSFITPGGPTSGPSIKNSFKYDVFLSFRGEDTRENFVDHLYLALKQKGIETYKDAEKIQKGGRVSDDLIKTIEDSKFYIIVFSKNYASSSWCLDELVKIMECQRMTGHTAWRVFYDMEPAEVRNQSGSVRKAFFKNKNKDAAEKWKGALKEAADLTGWELKNNLDGHKLINKIVQEILLINLGFDENLVGMETRVRDVISSLDIGSDEVRMTGIWGIGGGGKTTLARAVFDHITVQFEGQSFVENVREVSKASMSGLKKLQEQVLSDVLNEHITVNGVTHGQNMMKERMHDKKVLLVLDDVDHIDQLKALAGEPKWFKPGSRILITTRDVQVLQAHRVSLIHDIVLLSEQEAICLFSRCVLGRENPHQGYEELSRKFVRYAAGLPFIFEVLGSLLYGKDKDELVDAMDRFKKNPYKEILERLELSYIGLEDDYKEIFLDIACILKGQKKEDAIRILEYCGYHPRIGLKVLEQRSLITTKGGYLGMHDHIEEMGKNIVRREHPDEPNKHSHLWIDEEIEDILANDKGTEETRCLKLNMRKGNLRILMKGLGKMKKLRYLEVDFKLRYYDSSQLDESTQYFPNSLKYLVCWNYPFLYLPKTLQANTLVGLHMTNSRMVQLWDEEEKLVFKKLKFLSLTKSNLATFDFRMTPSLETLILRSSEKLVELCMPVSCQKLKHLDISDSKLGTFDLVLTPNLKTLSLDNCADFVELHVSVACPNLKVLNLSKSRLRSLDLEQIPNLERLDLAGCDKLVEINAPVGCLKKVVYFKLSGCLRFTDFEFSFGSELRRVSCSSATLDLVGQSLDLCPLHLNSNLIKLQFRCFYDEYLPLSVGNIEKLISFGLCACTDFEIFSGMLCSLRCLKKLKLHCCIPEFPKDLGQLECLEKLHLSSTKIKHLPDSICRLKHLKSLTVDHCDLLEKLPEDLGRLECLEKLKVSGKKIEYLPDSVCDLKYLKSLKVDDGDLLEKLPEDLGQLVSLEKLKVSSKKIGYLPDSICMLKHLKWLGVPDCSCLGKLPEDIGQVEFLEKLDLSATVIKHLPDSICMLKHLKYLKLDHCALLEKLPGDLGRLEYLDEIVNNTYRHKSSSA